MGELPWSKFFWSDWESDQGLRLCSLSAQGLWMRMLCVCAKGDPKGYLAINGTPLDSTGIARLCGAAAEEVEALMSELELNGVFSRDVRGWAYSRRMVRDAKKSATGKKFARKRWSGTPTQEHESKRENPPPNGSPNGVPTQNPHAKRLEARGQKEEEFRPKTAKRRISYTSEFDVFWKAYPTDANMSKKEAWQEWKRLDSDDQSSATASLLAFNGYCQKNSDYRPVHANRYLKYRRFDGHLEAAKEFAERSELSKVKLVNGTPPFAAWNEYRMSRGERPISRGEWWFPSEWPPGHQNSAKPS